MKLLRRVALTLAAIMSMTEAAHANEWKVDAIQPRLDLISSARELQDTDRREFLCMALAVFHEAKGETLEGKRAVAHVVLNRRRGGGFPSSVCGVVFQRGQFSWTVRPLTAILPREALNWQVCQQVALDVIRGEDHDPSRGSTYFHARREHPRWRFPSLKTILGGHVFIARMP